MKRQLVLILLSLILLSCNRNDILEGNSNKIEYSEDFIRACNIIADNNNYDLNIHSREKFIEDYTFLLKFFNENTNIKDQIFNYINENLLCNKTKAIYAIGVDVIYHGYYDAMMEINSLASSLGHFDITKFLKESVTKTPRGIKYERIWYVWLHNHILFTTDEIKTYLSPRAGETYYSALLMAKMELIDILTKKIIKKHNIVSDDDDRIRDILKPACLPSDTYKQLGFTGPAANHECVVGVIGSLKDKIVLTDKPFGVIKKSQIKALFDFFGSSPDYKLIFDIGRLQGANGRTIRIKPGHYKITIDYDYANNATLLSLARTIIHETIHAQLFAKTGMRDNLTTNELMKVYAGDTGISHHELMAKIVMSISGMLEEWDDGRQSKDYYMSLAWGGLYDTKLFKSLRYSEREKIKKINYNEQTSSLSSRGVKCPHEN